MKRLIKIILVVSLLLVMAACQNQDSGNMKKVGIMQYAEHPALDESYRGFIDALEDAGFKDGENIKIDYQNSQGDQATTETIADKLVNDQNELIYAIATPAAQAVAQKTQEIPVVVAAVTDPEQSGLVETNEKPNGNITGVSDLTPVKEQIKLLQQLLPEVKKVAILYGNSEDNSKFQAELAKIALKEAGLEVQEATVSDISQIQQVTESLVGKVDALYIPTDNLISEGIATVTMVANEKNLPSIVGEIALVEGGGLATDGVDYYNLGYLAGKQAVLILKGEAEPANMPIEYLQATDRELAVNVTIAEQLGIKIPQEILDQATIVE